MSRWWDCIASYTKNQSPFWKAPLNVSRDVLFDWKNQHLGTIASSWSQSFESGFVLDLD